jgi:geranylgeranyl reductase family protein
MSAGTSLRDAIVVGGGPAGASAARDLARRGHRVLILERSPWPRYKTCGGGLVWRARRRLDIDLQPAVERQVYRAELHLHDADLDFAVERREPLITMTMRSALDAQLITAARADGAEMLARAPVTRLSSRRDFVEVEAAGRIYRARFVVVADGAAGGCADLMGWSGQPWVIPALESELTVDRSTHERFANVARFDFPVGLAGYAWVFPKRAGLSVGCLSRHRRRPALRRLLETYLERLDIQPLQRQDHGFVIPVRPRSRNLAHDRILLTGDAAGLADPVTCEGISSAILSGQLAAESLVSADFDPGAVAADYMRALERTILAELRLARPLAWLLFEAPRSRRLFFGRLGQPLSEAMADIIAGERTYRDLLTSSSSYREALRHWRRATDTYPKG